MQTHFTLGAVGDDHDSFAQAAVLLPVLTRSGPLMALAFIRWTSYAYPKCKVVFRRDYWLKMFGLAAA
jgi:hypothetical protein